MVEAVAARRAERLREEQVLHRTDFLRDRHRLRLRVFSPQGVDVAVLEVGMGGRWDATNVAPASLTVITEDRYGSRAFLGSTLTEIASEKAATIKEGPTGRDRFHRSGTSRGDPRRSGETGLEVVRDRKGGTDRDRAGGEGQYVRLETPRSIYEMIYLPLEGGFSRRTWRWRSELPRWLPWWVSRFPGGGA